MLFGVVGAVLAALGLSFCVYLWLELQRRLTAKDIASELQRSSEELSKIYAKQFRDIETEWLDMYQKLTRLAGRMDKTRGLDQPTTIATAETMGTRSDLLRHRKKGGA